MYFLLTDGLFSGYIYRYGGLRQDWELRQLKTVLPLGYTIRICKELMTKITTTSDHWTPIFCQFGKYERLIFLEPMHFDYLFQTDTWCWIAVSFWTCQTNCKKLVGFNPHPLPKGVAFTALSAWPSWSCHQHRGHRMVFILYNPNEIVHFSCLMLFILY